MVSYRIVPSGTKAPPLLSIAVFLAHFEQKQEIPPKHAPS